MDVRQRIPVVVNGLPGKMGNPIAERILCSNDFYLYGAALTGPEITQSSIVVGNKEVFLYKPSERDSWLRAISGASEKPIVIDFTHPSAVNSNADLYCANGLNFIMGTTGGDRKALEERVRESSVWAVIAPNMAKQIVAFQEFMQKYSEHYPNSLKDCKLEIVESHQKGKADTSGTAKAMVTHFNGLGIPFTQENIHMIRDPEVQKALGVPEEFLGGHGWHSYKISKGTNTEVLFESAKRFLLNSPAFEGYRSDQGTTSDYTKFVSRISPDGTILFKLEKYHDNSLGIDHNVNGRSVYVDGVMDALMFGTRGNIQKGKAYSMIDVIFSG